MEFKSGANLMEYAGDVHRITTFDGEELTFPDENNRFLAYVGYGAPPINYITRRSYKQHGETKVDYQLGTRSISIQLWKRAACDRATYWAYRLALHDMLRPNRGGSLELTLIIPDGTQRAIKVDANPGAQFLTSQLDDNNWEINEPLEFIAFDPVWYNPIDTSTLVTIDPADQHLVFPITFPIQFGLGGTFYSETITYTGSWESYPRFIITGPYNSVIITNQSTGIALSLTVPISAGQSRTIDLTPGAISIVDENGVNQFGDLGDGSNLVDWNIRPDPLVAGGQNVVIAQIFGNDVTSSFTVEYNERYFAI